LQRLELVQFKSLVLIANLFLIETYISTGIYPYNNYDFDMYFTNAISLNYLYLEFILLQDVKINKLINDVIDYNGDTLKLLQLAIQTILPSDQDVYAYFDGEIHSTNDEIDDEII